MRGTVKGHSESDPLRAKFYRLRHALIGPAANNSIGFDAGCQKIPSAVPRFRVSHRLLRLYST